METPTNSSVDVKPQHYSCFAQKTELYPQKPWTCVKKRQPIVAEYHTPGPNGMPMPFYIGKQVLNSAIIHRPAWSLHQRIEQRQNTHAASPASYSTRDLKVKGGKVMSPCFTMRIKPKTRLQQESPGPATYKVNTGPVLKHAPAFSLRIKLNDQQKFRTPASNEYTLPSVLGHHHKPPSHIMGCKMYNTAPEVTPGPGAYPYHNFNKILRNAPAFSIKERARETWKTSLPGPGSYCPEKVILNFPMAPRPSMGIKHSPYIGKWNPRIVGPHCS